MEGAKIRVTFRAVDSFSPISQAEYSIDAGDWQQIEPVGQISDSKTESYDFMIPVPSNVGADTKQDVKPDDPAVCLRGSTRSSCASTIASRTWKSARWW